MALLECPEGLVLQLRDDIPEIPHPGCWSFFGGALEPGEDPRTTVARELSEELGIADLEYEPKWRIVDEEGDGRLLTIFYAMTSARPDEMVLGEGQDLRAFTVDDALGLRLAGFCRRVLIQHRHDLGLS